MSKRTKKMLADAFLNQLKTKSFKKITISDITSACDMTRMAFYYHFEDIYALVDWIFCEIIESSVSKDPSVDTWQNDYLNVFIAMRDKKVIIEKIWKSVDLINIEKMLVRLTHSLIDPVIDEKAKGKMLNEIDKKMISDFYIYALVGSLMRWATSGMKDEPNVVVDRLGLIINGTLEKAINTIDEKNRLS